MGIVQLIRHCLKLETLDVPGLGFPAADLAQASWTAAQS